MRTTPDSRLTQKQIEKLIDAWAPVLGLSTWTFTVKVTALSSEDNYMEVSRSANYDRAILWVNPFMVKGGPDTSDQWEEINPNFIERCVVHELVHCCVRDMRYRPFDLIEGKFSEEFQETLETVWRAAEEAVVDRLATSLCNTFSQLKE